jgi:HSP20 family molecular chaperone IbpA
MARKQELAPRQQTEVTRREEKPQYYRPAVDVSEMAEGLILRYDMPGVSKGNVEITVDKGILMVTGKAQPETAGTPVYRETYVGDYRREFTLPEDVDADRITAEMNAGVLTIRIHKAEKAKPRKIAIAAGRE